VKLDGSRQSQYELSMTPEWLVGVDHIGIAVKDLGVAKTTYEQILGFSLGHEEVLEERGISVQFVHCGTSRLELIAPNHEHSEVSKFLEKRGEGIHHICLEVKNIDFVLKVMHERGAQLIDQTPRPGANNSRVAFLHPKGTHGVLLELVEHRKTN